MGFFGGLGQGQREPPGLREIAHTARLGNRAWSRERLAAVAEAGADFSPNNVLYGEWTEGWDRQAAEHLLSAISGEPTHGMNTVPCRLVVRESTHSPPSG